MKAGNGQHFELAYNGQAAVDEAMLIVGQRGGDQSGGGAGRPSSQGLGSSEKGWGSGGSGGTAGRRWNGKGRWSA